MKPRPWGYGRSRLAGTKKEAPKWSQFDEEPILGKIFEVAGTGVCADIGARGRIGSNVAFLIDRGWKAQLIDRGVNALIKDFPFTRFPNVTIVQAEVSAKNVNTILWKEPLDLLSIDIDGPDADVWEAMVARPRVLVIEAVPENRPKIMETSKARGYKLHAETGPNLIYIL